MTSICRRAAFLDRDGVINEDRGYVGSIERFSFLPGVVAACRSLAALDYQLVVVTNQGGIALGHYSEEDFQMLNCHMRETLARQGVELAAVYHCPYHPEGDARYAQWRAWRKPEPGMLLAAAQDLRLDLAASLMVGDAVSDMQAAAAAGILSRFYVGVAGAAPTGSVACASLAEATERVWALEGLG